MTREGDSSRVFEDLDVGRSAFAVDRLEWTGSPPPGFVVLEEGSRMASNGIAGSRMSDRGDGKGGRHR